MAETIWIVEGSSGQYEDYRCWNVCAFRTEDAANKYAELLSEQHRVFKAKWPLSSYEYVGKKEKMRAADLAKTLDPENCDDGDDVSYTVYQIELR